jgi:FMNH2-dependent dimethyl sulfone monooxygenase
MTKATMAFSICTWAPTAFVGPKIVRGAVAGGPIPDTTALRELAAGYVRRLEALGITHMLIAQRWWGSGEEMEGSTLDCLAMTAYFAAVSERLQLITAIHPGFFQPAVIAKWGATMDRLTGGRWAINVTSGWHLREFAMYGVDPLPHDERYVRATEFIEVLRGAWTHEAFDYRGRYFNATALQLEPRPTAPLVVYQGGQSNAAIAMAARHSDWMFLNGGQPEKIAAIVARVRDAARAAGRTVRFALYAQPLCRPSDAEAWAEIDRRLAAVDARLVERRKRATSGAEGMWSDDDPLAVLDTNEGFAARLIGSPDTVVRRIEAFAALGIERFHLDLRDPLFVSAVLPQLTGQTSA